MSGPLEESSGESPATAPSESLINDRVNVLRNIGMSSELIVSQLLSAGASVEGLKSRFPDLPARAFERPSPRLAPTRVLRPSRGEGTLSSGSPARPASASSLQPIARQLPTTSIMPVARAPSSIVEGISFHYVPLIQCSFPHADPGDARSFTRRNGWLELTLGTTKPDAGLPYGVPSRLLTIYCASEAVRTRSPEIYLGKSVHEFLKRLDVPITRGARGSLSVYSNQLLRLIHSTLSIDENIRDATGRTGLHLRQALFVDEARLWWDERSQVGQGSSLVLSSVLFNSILERSAPLSTLAIRQLRKSPMDLDVYAWLAHRLFHLSKPSSVTWQQLSDQFGHGYGTLRPFRRFFIDSLKRVQLVYPEAKLKLVKTGVLLLPSRPHVARSTAVTKR